jgi:hypothetical protein
MPEPPDPQPPDPQLPDPTVAWNKCQLYLDRLFDALQDLDEGGGLAAAAERGGWKGQKKLEKAAASLKAVRDQIDAELARLKAARRGPRK